MEKKEIERKFRLQRAPGRERLNDGIKILQGYLPVDGAELRVRQRGNEFFLTVKGGGTISRSEWESSVPEWVFRALWADTEGNRIEKMRYSVRHGAFVLEVDIYSGRCKDLVTLECEHPDQQALESLVLPDWSGPALDVTSDKAYKNRSLARNGPPSGK